jgi:pre-mRNA-splicing factor ATP-dependent RNA helicase DHX16
MRSLSRARDVRDQLIDMADRVELELTTGGDDEGIRKAITAGFFYNCAKLDGEGTYTTVKQKRQVLMHPGSCMKKEVPFWVIYFELVLTSKEYMRNVIEIEPEWLQEIAPHYYKKGDFGKAMEKKKKLPKKTLT